MPHFAAAPVTQHPTPACKHLRYSACLSYEQHPTYMYSRFVHRTQQLRTKLHASSLPTPFYTQGSDIGTCYSIMDKHLMGRWPSGPPSQLLLEVNAQKGAPVQVSLMNF
jgi:hypothetical protein